MANVYVTEIPNTPGIQEMPLPNYQDIPSIRYKPIDMTVDLSQEAAALQQQPLPGGFKRGSDIVAGALASGVRSAGVVGEGMQSVGNALSRAAGVLFKLQENAVNDQDAIAGQKAHENRAIFQARFEAETANMPMQEKLEWWNEHVGEVAALNSSYGSSQLTRDKIASSDNAFAQVGNYKIQTDAAQKESQDAINYSKDAIATGLQNPTEENIAKAHEANDTGHQRQWWNDDTYNANNDKIDRAAKIGFIDEKAGDPASAGWVKEQSEKQQRGEKNDLFTAKDDPAMWNHADDVATKTITEGQRTNAEKYHGILTNDPSKITKEDLKDQYNKGYLSPDQYEALEHRRDGVPIPFDEGKVAEALSKATTYDRNSDKDDKGRQSMKKYDEAVRYISENVPKEEQDEMLAILKANWTKTPDRSPQQQETKLTHANIDEWAESGILPDVNTKKPLPSGMEKGKIVNEEEYRSSQKRRLELHRMVEDYVNKHPDFTENELLDYIWGKAKGVVHSNVSAETAGVSTPLVATDPGFYTNIGIPGRPTLQGEQTPAKQVPVTEEEATAAVKAVKEGKPAPTKALPSGPGAPVEVTVYDRGDRTFRQARLAATPELLAIVEDESKIYDVILKSDETSLRGRLGMVSGDALDPDMKEGIVREATKLSKAKGISLLDAGMEVIGNLKAQAEQDKVRINEAIKNVSPTSAENVAAPTNVFQSKLAGTEPIFVAAANKYGLAPGLLMAISMHETGRGTSEAVKNYNNPGGLMDPKTDWQTLQKFPTIEAGIDAMAKNLKENYIDKGLTTIAQIQEKYAPIGSKNDPKGLNKDWTAGVTAFRNQLAMKRTSGTVAKQAGGLDSGTAEQISTLIPKAQPVMTSFMQKVREWGAANGLEVTVREGKRTPEKQAEYYAQGRTKPGNIITNAKPGQSKHETGKAVDLLVTRNGKQVDDEKIWQQIGRIGKSMGLEWGGEWRSIHDPEHFQYNA
jgi:hypothetical protein